MQNEQATQHRWLLPRRWCTNHEPVRDVLARLTSVLDCALFVKGTLDWIIVQQISTEQSKLNLWNIMVWMGQIVNDA